MFNAVYNLTSTSQINSAQEFAFEIQKQYKVVANLIFAMKETGEIGYVTQGLFPKRKYKVGQGSYTKLGYLNDNVWQGFLDCREQPYAVNPARGYIVSANNFITSQNVEWGISHSFAF